MRIAAGWGIACAVAGLLVSGILGCTRPDWIQSTLVTVDVSGEWQGNVNRPAGAYGPGLIYLSLRQSGPKVTGTFSYSPGPAKDVPLEGDAQRRRLAVSSSRWIGDCRAPSER